MAERHIVAMGGGGFLMERGSLLDDYVLALAGVAEPRVCYLGTAMGDEPGNIATFHRAFPPGRARATHLSLFQRDAADPRDHLLAQDAIYVGGGNTVNMLAIWRAHGVDASLAGCGHPPPIRSAQTAWRRPDAPRRQRQNRAPVRHRR